MREVCRVSRVKHDLVKGEYHDSATQCGAGRRVGLVDVGAVLAQTPARPDARENKSVMVGAQSPAAELGRPVFRASQLKGVEVRNTAGEKVGKIHDLVIDPHSGNAAYVALSVGGFLGMGDKLFAIPYDAFTFVPAEQAPTRGKAAPSGTRAENDQAITATGKLTDVVAVLDISKEILQKVQGFDQNNWPNMVDASWRTANDRAYQSLHRRQLNRSGEPAATELRVPAN